MHDVITIGEEYVPVEHIAYIEPFEPPANGQFKSDRPWKGRVVLLNRDIRVRGFKPTEEFNPAKPFQTQLSWRDPDGNSRRKLLLTKPEMVIAIVLRGETEPGVERKARPRRPAQPRAPRKRAAAPRAEA